MKKKSALLKLFVSDDLPFEARILNFVCFLGALATVVALMARIVEKMPLVTIMTVVVMLITILAVFFFSAGRLKNVRLITAIVVYGIGVVLFPVIFFTNGGADSGMAAYFTLCIVLELLMLKGKPRIVSLILTSAIVLSCYLSTLFLGVGLLPAEGMTPFQRFVDNMQSIFVSGFFMGFVIVFQNNVYLKEKDKADSMERERAAALEQALTASRAKSDFLSNMSHEMRTPMNAIIGMTAIGLASNTVEKKDYAFKKIDEASKHLLGVINDILDMSKIEANKLELSPVRFEFVDMLKNVVNIITLKADERRQHFYVNIDQNIPSSLIGDDHRLAQVITNLLSNAVKFTPEEGTIHMGAQLLSVDDGFCRIQIDVTDTGIGITPEQQSRLFNSFEQAEAGTSRKFGGTGLGLCISKKIVEMMGGAMWVESEPGNGAKFSFTIALKQGYKAQPPLLARDVSWENLRILAVDDDPEILCFFQEVALNLNITCDVASCGEEAIVTLARNTYDVYFFDWKLPDMNGVDLAWEVNVNAERKPVIIIFSSVDWSLIEDDARAAGVFRFLPKPLFQSSIVDVINECLNRKVTLSKNESKISHDDFSEYTVLLAEDVEINREIVLTLLEPTKLEIKCAENGAEAVDMFMAEPDAYDMVLMDIQMPEMDGFEATRRIRALDMQCAKEIPIMAMTANVFSDDVKRCLEAGMNAHVGKPLDFDELMTALRKYLA